MKTINNLIINLTLMVVLSITSISNTVAGSPVKIDKTIELTPSAPSEATFEESNTIDFELVKLFSLAPVTPEEADFSDGIPSADAILTILAPVTPKIADFIDEAPETITNLFLLAPATPAEADFTDTVEMPADLSFLAPVTPVEADFE